MNAPSPWPAQRVARLPSTALAGGQLLTVSYVLAVAAEAGMENFVGVCASSAAANEQKKRTARQRVRFMTEDRASIGWMVRGARDRNNGGGERDRAGGGPGGEDFA